MKIKGSRSKPLALGHTAKKSAQIFRGRQKLLMFTQRGITLNRKKIPYNSIAHTLINGKSIKLKVKETFIGVKNAVQRKF